MSEEIKGKKRPWRRKKTQIVASWKPHIPVSHLLLHHRPLEVMDLENDVIDD